jgi:hypothetical protein
MLGRGSGQQRHLAPLLPRTQASSTGAAAMQPVPLAPALPPHQAATYQLPRIYLQVAQQLQMQRQLMAMQSQLAVPPNLASQAELAARAAAAWVQGQSPNAPTGTDTACAAPADMDVAAPADTDVASPDFSASQHDSGSEQVRAHAGLAMVF